MSRIATGNWDAVIVTHSGFEKIPVSRETQEAFFKEQLRELALAIEQQRKEGDSRIVKALERAKKQLETKLKELAANEKKDDGLTFEELGVDRLFVDEAHYFKNLFYVSKMTRIAGLPQTASQRAFDMFLKVQHVQRVNGGGGVVFATGTPIANSVAEMFTMQRFLQMATLKAQNVAHFDAWAATFGEPVTAMELAPDGSGYRMNTRFCEVRECSGTDADVPAGGRHPDPGDAQAARAGPARRQAHGDQRALLTGVEADRGVAGGARRGIAHRPGGPARGQHAAGHHRRTESGPRSAAS